MSNDYFNVTGTPATKSKGASAPMRAEAALVQAGFDKLPGLMGNALNVVRVKADASGLEAATPDAVATTLAAVVFKGSMNCSSNPNYPAANKGHLYRVSVAGRIGGGSGRIVKINDEFMCLTDGMSSGNQAAVGGQWTIRQGKNVGDVACDTVTTGSVSATGAVTANSVSAVSGNVSGDLVIGGTASASVLAGTNASVAVNLGVGGDLVVGGASTTLDVNGRIYGGALHNNFAGASDPTKQKQFVASGTFTPTFTGLTNVASGACLQANWLRVGNVVTVAGWGTLVASAANTATSFRMSLPIDSDLTGSPPAGAGTVAVVTNAGITAPQMAGYISNSGSPTGMAANFAYDGGSLSTSFSYQYTYIVR